MSVENKIVIFILFLGFFILSSINVFADLSIGTFNVGEVTIDGTIPTETASFTTKRYDVLTNVPIITSPLNESFETGTLWDTKDDSGNGEFDEIDKKNLNNLNHFETQNYSLNLCLEKIFSYEMNKEKLILVEATIINSKKNNYLNIYKSVKEKDNVWTKQIYNKQFIKIKFNKPLKNGNDIKIYGRSISRDHISIKVFTVIENIFIGEIKNIKQENYYKIFLKNMPYNTNEFLLEIVGDNIESSIIIDHITDPAPIIDSITLNSTNLETNYSNENLTAYTIASDPDNDNIKLIYNWHVNKNPLLLLNVPFEKINSSNTYNTKNYAGINHHNGSDSGSVIWNESAGYDGRGAYIFPSAGGPAITFPVNFMEEPLKGVSMEARFNTTDTDTTSQMNIISTERWALIVNRLEAGNITVQFDGSAIDSPHRYPAAGKLNDGAWHHVIATNNKTHTWLYVDGKELFNFSETRDSLDGYNNPMAIGSNFNSGSSFFHGTIDEVRIWNRSLTQAMVKALYKNLTFSNRTSTIPWTETSSKENWTVDITPNDGDSDGVTVRSNQIIILPESTYNIYYGHTINNMMVLSHKSANQLSLISIINPSSSVIYVTDKDSSFNFNDLKPLGYKTDGTISSNDFSEVDTSIGLSGLSNSIENLFSTDGSNARFLKDISVYGRNLKNIPIINSTNSSTFITGILWDSADDTNQEFDNNEKEDLIFITKTNPITTGRYGKYNYEIKIPRKLKNYKGNNNIIEFYLELS